MNFTDEEIKKAEGMDKMDAWIHLIFGLAGVCLVVGLGGFVVLALIAFIL